MVITLTTDFGYQDSFVGIMKGVIAGINPQAQVIDLTHGIPAQDILAGALTLRYSIQYFPRGTIHVAVIDPGVGSARRPIMVESAGNYFVGPDNGVLSLALQGRVDKRITHLSNPAYHLRPISVTFHGRDIFAPVAAHLSLGMAPTAFGETLEDMVRIELPAVIRKGRQLHGEIIYIDSFGNLFTNIQRHDLTGVAEDRVEITVGSIRVIGLAANYSTVSEGDFAAVFNSWDLLEIALNRDNAQKRSGAKIGDEVEINFDA